MKADAAIAAGGNANRQSDQFFGFGIQCAILHRGLVQSAKAGLHFRYRCSELRQTFAQILSNGFERFS